MQNRERIPLLAIKEVKEKEIPVVGVFCTYLPREIPNAMGAAVVGLCSVSDETIQMQKKICQETYVIDQIKLWIAKTDNVHSSIFQIWL